MRSILLSVLSLFAFVTISAAQTSFGFVNNITAVPVPGVGHDYLHDLDETVSPANGSLSVRIEAPRPKERGLNYPFYSFMYDSTQQFAVIYQPESASSYNCGPDTTSDGPGGAPPQPLTCVYPPISFDYVSYDWPAGSNGVLSGPNSMLGLNTEYSREIGSGTFETCQLYGAYSYEDPYGVVHSLGAYGENEPNNGCDYLGIQFSPIGGDEQYKIALSDTVLGIQFPSNGTTITSSPFGALIDAHGNSVQVSPGPGAANLAMEDTNGNAVSGTVRSGSYQSFQPWGDAFAKTASRTFAGGSTYNYTWGTATSSFSPNYADESVTEYGYDNLCKFLGNSGGGSTTNNVVTQMQEPDKLYYTFSYDPTYGLINKITYPTGAWVEYTWGVNSLSDASGFSTPAPFVNSYNDPIHITPGVSMNTSCMFEHDTPAIVKRVVSYDGVHPAEEQDFSYSTNWGTGGEFGDWSSKQTIVTTKDLLTNGTPSFKTIYNYSPLSFYASIGTNLQSSPLPLENTILYYDTNGSLLRTVTKAWNSYLQLAAECTTLPDGNTSGTFYQYEAYPVPGGLAIASNPSSVTTNQLTDVAEYDYGLVTTPCQRPSSTPTKETVTTYASFSNTPLWPTLTTSGNPISMPPMVDRPATVITYQNGTKVAETDYSYDQTAVASISPTPLGHDETNYGNGSTVPRGNLTTLTRKCFQGSTTCTNSVTQIAFDTTGQPVSVTDADNNQTTLSYADNYTTDDGSPSGNTNTYLTKITRPTTYGIAHIESFQWDFNKGELRTLTDENNNQTLYQYADPWWRLTQATFPDGGSTSKTYQDAGPNPTVTTTTAINSCTNLVSTTIMDAAGHVIHTQLNSDPEGVDYVDRVYDGLGRVASVTNSYRSTSDPTYGITSFNYDSLNRKTIQVQPDGSKLQWCYNNIASSGQTNCAANASSQSNDAWIDSSDEVGNHWQRTYDAFGRMTAAMEPNGSSPAPSMETDYSYDGLDDLIGVVQKGNNPSNARTRTFYYDSLARLTSATNPESGTISYSYDPNGNLLTRTDARGITSTLAYDALNRLTSKTYSDGTPTADFVYDTKLLNPIGSFTSLNPIGRLVKTSISLTAECAFFSYDAMGRVAVSARSTSKVQCIRRVGEYNGFSYQYNFLGQITSEVNTQNFTVSYSYDAAGRVTQITSSLSDSQHPATLATLDPSVGYWPNGAIRKMTLGNGLTETAAYNNRLQPCRMNVNSSATALGTCADAIPSGNVQDFNYGFNVGSSDNGNVASWVATGQQTFNRSFAYDTLNRIAALIQSSGNATSCSSTFSLSWTIDPWGNRTNQTVTGGTCNAFTQSASTNNQLVGPPYQYDAAGNMTADGNHTYTYDAENRPTQVDGGNTATYTYDASGQRIQKTVGSTTTNYFYNISGQVGAEESSAWGPEYVYLGDRLIAEYENSTTYFVHKDHLGSTRLMTTVSQSTCDNMDYLPFGEQIAGGSCSTHKFTGKERDSESGLDNFGARYNSSSMGRFMSPDPLGGHLEDPQTLNRYAYVRNNPLNLTDPTGLDFYLRCTHTDNNGSTCQQQVVGKDKEGNDVKAFVQGVTGDNGKFTATQIGNDANGNLVDKTTGTGFYTGTVEGTGVQFAQQGRNAASAGIWVNGSPDTKFTQTSGALTGFSFDFQQTSKEQTAKGTFYYPGAPRDAYEAILKAGFSAAMADDFFNPLHGYIGSYHYRSAGDPGTGRNSGHLIIRGVGIFHPWDTVPTRGDLHFGETNPQVNFFQHFSKDVF